MALHHGLTVNSPFQAAAQEDGGYGLRNKTMKKQHDRPSDCPFSSFSYHSAISTVTLLFPF